MSSATALLTACGLHRLIRDLKEVLRCPLPDVVCLPAGQTEDIYVWHGNVRSHEGCLSGATIHFMLVFPPTYPSDPPECRLFQPVPHPNVRTATAVAVHGKQLPREARWRLALWDCVPGTSTWSGAYTVYSILLQLQAFLLIEDMSDFATQSTGTVASVNASATSFVCPHCKHKPTAPYPPFLSEEGIAAATAAARQAKTLVSRPIVPPRSQEAAMQLLQHQQPRVAANLQARPRPASGKVATPTSSTAGAAAARGSTSKAPASDEWTVVKGTKGKAAVGNPSNPGNAVSNGSSALSLSATHLGPPTADEKLWHVNNKFGTLQLKSVVKLLTAPASSQATKPGAGWATAAAGTAAKPGAAWAKAASTAAPSVASSAASDADSSTNSTPVLAKIVHKSQLQSNDTGSTWSKVEPKGNGAGGSKAAPALSLPSQAASIREVLEEWRQEQQRYEQLLSGSAAAGLTLAAAAAPAADGHQGDVLLGLQQPMGLFSMLARDDLLAVLCLLRPKDVAALSCSCKGLRAASKDGALWQALIQSHYPAAALAASRMSDWQHTYMLEANNVLEDLRCFYTRTSFEEDVLCLPLNFTINPKTSAVDYIEAYPDFIALSALHAGVDRTSGQEPIKAALPLYLTADHFARAQSHYPRVLRTLAPTAISPGGGSPPPQTWLEVLPKILNTAVVLLCDKGHAASHKSLAVYAAMHRLLLAMCEQHNLWGAVRHRLDTFLGSKDARSKQECPNLGLLLPLLSLSRTHSWTQLAPPLLEETLARSVMWICKANPSLEAKFTAPRKSAEDVDAELLQQSWEAARVSTRLMMFHVVFMHLVGAPPGCSLETVMDGADALYGHPGNALGTRFLKAMHRVMQVGSWKEYYCLLGLPPMTDVKLTALLKAAWANSCKRGYTRPGMDYGRIQQSGVSKILMKGESYTAPPGMKRIELVDCWSWRPNTGTRFLDASVILYSVGEDNMCTHLETIDFSHTSSMKTAKRGAVTHSGDVMTAHDGKHTVRVDLAGLGPNVLEMFIVVSAWNGAYLSDIIQPYVQVQDPATKMSLCEYHLEDQSKQVRMSNSSVIMARVYKVGGRSSGPGGSWKVQALGVVGDGDASNYGPILDTIAAGSWTDSPSAQPTA